MSKIRTVYSSTKSNNPLRKTSGVIPQRLDGAAIWSDILREARNAIHFGVQPTIAYRYEGVAILLMGEPSYLKIIYRIKAAADELTNM